MKICLYLYKGTDGIQDIHVVNTGAVSYQSKTSEKCVETDERKNKKKCLNICLNKNQHFTPFVALVDGHPECLNT